LLKEYLEHEELRIFGPDEEPNSPQESKDPVNTGCISEAELTQQG
jgi:hypothetical protein